MSDRIPIQWGAIDAAIERDLYSRENPQFNFIAYKQIGNKDNEIEFDIEIKREQDAISKKDFAYGKLEIKTIASNIEYHDGWQGQRDEEFFKKYNFSNILTTRMAYYPSSNVGIFDSLDGYTPLWDYKCNTIQRWYNCAAELLRESITDTSDWFTWYTHTDSTSVTFPYDGGSFSFSGEVFCNHAAPTYEKFTSDSIFFGTTAYHVNFKLTALIATDFSNTVFIDEASGKIPILNSGVIYDGKPLIEYK